MKADVGDRLVTEGACGQRECVIISLHNADGSPPYVVRWLSDGHIVLMSPGPYTRLVHGEPPGARPAWPADVALAWPLEGPWMSGPLLGTRAAYGSNL